MSVVELRVKRFRQMEDATVVDLAAYLERRFHEDIERQKAMAKHPSGRSSRFLSRLNTGIPETDGAA